MRTCGQLLRALQEGAYDQIFKKLYAPDGNEAAFKRGIEAVFGAGKCHVLHIRPVGGCMMIS